MYPQETTLVCLPLIDCSDSDYMSVRYYVQTSVMPPKVSFTHPVDMVPVSRRASPYAPMNNTQMPQPQLAVPPRNPSQSGGGLTFAQQLYASSVSSSLGPMINSQSATHLPTPQLPPIHIRHLPTPSPSSSPPPGTGVHFSNAPLNGHGMPPNSLGSQSSYPSHQTSLHTMNRPSPNFNSTPSSAPPFSNPHRTNTFQTPVLSSNDSHPQRHRASTYDQGMSQHPVNVNPSIASSRPTRHLVTMARPPDQQSSSALSPLLLEPPATVHSAPAVPSPPPSSILFSQTAGTISTSPLSPPLTSVQSAPPTTSMISVRLGTTYEPRNSISPLGRVAGGATIPIAAGVVGALQSVLLTPGTGVDQLSLQAVIQGRPDADYQKITNALMKMHQQQQHQFSLMKLQMQRPPSPTIDYQVLISEVQKLQSLAQVATAQQQEQQPLQGQQQQLTAAQQYQALIQQQYQQQAAIQRQRQQMRQALTQQQQQVTQSHALQQQQAAEAQQNQVSLNAYARPPQPIQFQQHAQSAAQTYLEVNKQFQHINHQSPHEDGGSGLFDNFSRTCGNPGGNDSGGFSDFLSVSFNQDNSGGFDMTYVDVSGQSN